MTAISHMRIMIEAALNQVSVRTKTECAYLINCKKTLNMTKAELVLLVSGQTLNTLMLLS